MGRRNNPPVSQASERTFFMIMINELGDHIAQVCFAKINHLVGTFILDSLDEPFRVGICLRRALHPTRMMGRDKFGSCIRSIRFAVSVSRW
jgi:hypothetical protein